MTRTVPALLLLFALAACSVERSAPEPEEPALPLPELVAELAALRAEAYEAYEEADHETLQGVLRRAHALQPASPRWTYNLAASHAAAGENDEALRWIGRTYQLGAVFDYAQDPDFAALVEEGGLEAFKARQKALERPLMRASEAFSLGAHDLVAEAIAYDAERERFLVSSARQRSILSVDATGHARPFVESSHEGLGGVLGLSIDAQRGWIWACSASIPEMVVDDDEPPVEPSVFRFELASGRVLSRHALPPAAGPRTPNDALVLTDGTLLVSDSSQGAIYRVRPDDAGMETLVPAGSLRSPQGIAPAPHGSLVIVADYSLGLLSLDPESGEIKLLEAPPSPTLVGIDGLSSHDLGFVAVQNGVRPARVLRIEVSGDLTRVESVETLERAHPAFDEPTTGCVVGDAFYFVANSHWGGFDERGEVRTDLSDHIVMRLFLRE